MHQVPKIYYIKIKTKVKQNAIAGLMTVTTMGLQRLIPRAMARVVDLFHAL
jgi:phosphoribosylaminoimidazole (AIR) synthetase